MSGRIDAQMLDQEKSEEEEQKEPLRVEIDKDQKNDECGHLQPKQRRGEKESA